MSKIRLSQVKGSATYGGHNHRNPFVSLGMNEVTFPSQLTQPDPENADAVADTRVCLYNLVFGADATDESKAEFIKLMRQEPEIWAMAQNMSQPGIGQLDAAKVVAIGANEYALEDGERRWCAKTLAFCLTPEIMDDSFEVVLVEGDESLHNQRAVSANSHRKGLSAVEIGRIVARNKENGIDYKSSALQLGLYQKAVKGKAPVPNHQQARNFALLHSDKISDDQRAKIAEGTLSYTKVLKSVGLMKDGSDNGVQRDESQPQKKRKASKSLKELNEIYGSRKEVEKLVEAIEKKGIDLKKDTFEVVRAVLARAMNAKWKQFKEEVPEAPAGEEDAA